MREALTSFKNVYNMSDNKINRVAFLIKAFDDRNYTNSERCENGNSFYYFKVKDYPNIFVGSSQISSQLPVTMVIPLKFHLM
jgi:hypothetical protein